ncbi:MAG TPA: TrmB family transcriptional regulator [Candidatus Avacidaminococcus intestinavium]|uniref:TrmB family transcriptional regulator n=1 Tax=Candidatus Avacidaminococcus intestinavium TaxID=2840684 RepID=A0A9D1MQ19_9FIRM|nr:TrmB family transcriptional regulator [Candidatus Avacidaminococcus intestinavium]
MELIDYLLYFNLTRHEATLYMALLASGSLTGYEAAKLTGISRSNTYTGLAGLVDKGAAYIAEEKATRYVPVPCDEFCDNKIRLLQKYKKHLVAGVPSVQDEVEGYITIKSDAAIMDKLKNMIVKARVRIYISAAQQLVETLTEELSAALARGLKVVVITGYPYKLDGAVIYYNNEVTTQIRLIADSGRVLTGDLLEGANATCLYSGKKNLVTLFKDAMKNEIKLIELTNK